MTITIITTTNTIFHLNMCAILHSDINKEIVRYGQVLIIWINLGANRARHPEALNFVTLGRYLKKKKKKGTQGQKDTYVSSRVTRIEVTKIRKKRS